MPHADERQRAAACCSEPSRPVRIVAIPFRGTPCWSSGETTLRRWWRRTLDGFGGRFAAWGRYGVSAFVARDDAEVAALCQSRLVAWARVLVFRLGALEASGVEVVATFRTPHVTIAHIELDELVRRLLECEHEVVENPYYEGEPGDQVADIDGEIVHVRPLPGPVSRHQHLLGRSVA